MRVMKIGGSLLDGDSGGAGMAALVSAVAALESPPVIVHGGGKEIARLQAKLGLQTETVEGLRVTDRASMEVVRMVLSGTVNGRLVEALVVGGVDAQGMSGADRGLLRCRKLTLAKEDLGYVGEITSVRADVLLSLVDAGVVPVVSPVSLGEDGEAYNVNADSAAAAIASALGALQLDLVSDVPGVLVEDTTIAELQPDAVERLIDEGTIAGGMVPKVRAALDAVALGVERVRIVDLSGLADEAAGTVIVGLAPDRAVVTSPSQADGATATAGMPSDLGDDGAPVTSGMPHDVETGSHPAVDGAEIMAADAKFVLQTYARPPIVFTRGEGAWLESSDGRRYLDFNAGIAVNALGHADPEWADAVRDQVGLLAHTSNLYYTAPGARLARRLVQTSFADRVYFCNTGAEAIETAIKVSRKNALVQAQKRAEELPDGGGEGRGIEASPGDDPAPTPTPARRIVAFERSFHGRSIGALSLTYKPAYREPFQPLMPDVTFVPFGDLDAALAVIDSDTCAVFVEPVQGEGGYHPAPDGFLEGLRAACDETGALLVFDEVQCGLGRTGRLWAHEHWGVTPDIMAIAKPLAGGMPIGAALMTQAVADVMGVGDHGSTFAGGPLVCRAAEVVLDRVSDPKFLSAVNRRGERLVAGLLGLDSERIIAVRGLGLMVGVDLDVPVAGVVEAAREDGVLLIGAGVTTLRLCPPLILTDGEIDTAVETIGRALASQAALDADEGGA